MIARMIKMIDIGANLTDPMFKGIYNGSKKHEDDLKQVLERSWSSGVEKIIITSGSLKGAAETVELSNLDDRLYRTVGCHPTNCLEIEEIGESKYFDLLAKYIEADINKNNNHDDDIQERKNNKNNENNNNGKNNSNIDINHDRGVDDNIADNNSNSNIVMVNKVLAVGECGLDYDRLEFCPKKVQLKYLSPHLHLSHQYDLPLFLHCRQASTDLLHMLSQHRTLLCSGVVHSYDGNLDDALKFIELGMYIGINGCSLKKPENLEVVKQLPVDRILIETDAPWCEIKPSHASFPYVKTHHVSRKKEKHGDGLMVKGRNEPANLRQILEVLADIRNEDIQSLSQSIFQNTFRLFKFPSVTASSSSVLELPNEAV